MKRSVLVITALVCTFLISCAGKAINENRSTRGQAETRKHFICQQDGRTIASGLVEKAWEWESGVSQKQFWKSVNMTNCTAIAIPETPYSLILCNGRPTGYLREGPRLIWHFQEAFPIQGVRVRPGEQGLSTCTELIPAKRSIALKDMSLHDMVIIWDIGITSDDNIQIDVRLTGGW